MAITVSRKQRLRTLENKIRKAAESIMENGLEIGRWLCEIRDEELWSDDYESWNKYLKSSSADLVGKTFTAAAKLIQSAEIEKRLPISINVYTNNLTASHLREFSRLAPEHGKGGGSRGKEKDYSKIRKADITRVWQAANVIAEARHPDNGQVSVRDIRQAVDNDLGVDRSRSDQADEPEGIDLPVYMESRIGVIEGILENLEPVPLDGWKRLAESHPDLCERLAEACENLAAFLRQ